MFISIFTLYTPNCIMEDKINIKEHYLPRMWEGGVKRRKLIEACKQLNQNHHTDRLTFGPVIAKNKKSF